MKTCVCMILALVLQGAVWAGIERDLSNTSFAGKEAKTAQQAYNEAVREAWLKYQAQVNAAGRKYSAQLETAYKKEVAADNLQEALKIKQEMGKFMFDFTDGLVLYMSFDKQAPGGKVLDNSPTGNHGQAEGAVWTEQGQSGGAYAFDIRQKTNRIVIPDSDSLDCKTITICVWVKTDDDDEFWNRIIDKDWRKGYALCLGGGSKEKHYWGKVFFELDERSVIGSNNSIADNNWHHVIARYDGEFMELYIDGHLQNARMRRPGQITINKYPVAIGGTYPGYDVKEFLAFNGQIDELMIYNRALSPKEIQALREKSIDAVMPDKPAGIGVKLSNHPEGVIVDEVFNITRGLQKGDIIIGADGVSFADKSLMQAIKILRGPEGSTVTVEVKKPDGTIKKIFVVRQILSNMTSAAGGKK